MRRYNCVQATPDCALLFMVAQVSGAPDAERSPKTRAMRHIVAIATAVVLSGLGLHAADQAYEQRFSDLRARGIVGFASDPGLVDTNNPRPVLGPKPLTLLLAACFMCPAGPPALAATIQEIERLPFDQAYRLWLQEEEALFHRSASTHSAVIIPGGSTDAKTGKFTPTSFQALTCRLGRDAHTHEAFLLSALRTNAYVSMILDTSSRLCSRYGIESQAMVLYDSKLGYSSVTRDFGLGPDAQRNIWLKAMTKPIFQPTGPTNGSQPFRPQTDRTSAATGSRR